MKIMWLQMYAKFVQWTLNIEHWTPANDNILSTSAHVNVLFVLFSISVVLISSNISLLPMDRQMDKQNGVTTTEKNVHWMPKTIVSFVSIQIIVINNNVPCTNGTNDKTDTQPTTIIVQPNWSDTITTTNIVCACVHDDDNYSSFTNKTFPLPSEGGFW